MKFNREFELGKNEGSSQLATHQYIIIHDTGNDNNKGINSGRNEAQYMKAHWQSAYTHAIVDDNDIYIVGTPSYVAYGAGNIANRRSPFQIELAHVNSQARFNRSYKMYIEAIKYFANKYNIPLTLDTSGNGIKSHLWVSENIWGDHTDPYGYLKKWGISKAQLIDDLGVKSAKNNDYYERALQVRAKTKVSRYRDLSFKRKVDTFPKGTLFDIYATIKYKNITRFKLANGLYITSNKAYVKRLK